MKLWIMVAIIVGVLVIASFGIVSFVKADERTSKPVQNSPSCGCGNKCTQANNCGLATCGAVNGKACGCNAAK